MVHHAELVGAHALMTHSVADVYPAGTGTVFSNAQQIVNVARLIEG